MKEDKLNDDVLFIEEGTDELELLKLTSKFKCNKMPIRIGKKYFDLTCKKQYNIIVIPIKFLSLFKENKNNLKNKKDDKNKNLLF